MKTDYQHLLHLILVLYLTSSTIIAQGLVLKPYLQNNSRDQISILWETNRSGQCYIDWGTDPFSLNNTLTSTFISSSGINRIHTATILNLLPNTKHHYKVRTASATLSSLYNFRTHPSTTSEKDLRFVAMSDMQPDSNNPSVLKAL